LREALPLVAHLSAAEWQSYFRLHSFDEVEVEFREEFRAAANLLQSGMPPTRRWRIESAEGEVDPGGRDARALLFRIERGVDVRPVTIYIAGTALAVALAGLGELPDDVAEAIDTNGRSVVVSVLAIDEPPRKMMVSTTGIRPLSE